MAQTCVFFQLRYYFLIFHLQIFVSGERCCRQWTFQPLVTGGYGRVRSVGPAYSARKCLIRGHHLAMVSTRNRRIELVCIKDEIYATISMLSTTTFQTPVTLMDNPGKKFHPDSKSNPPQTGYGDETTSTFSPSYYTEVTADNELNSTDKINIRVSSSEAEVAKMTTRKVVADIQQRSSSLIGSKSELLKDKKLTSDLIEFTEKEKLTKSFVCCNPSLNK